MDLQTGDRAEADVAALPGGQPGVPEPGDGAGAPAPRRAAERRACTERSPGWRCSARPRSRSASRTYAGVQGRGGVADAARVALACVVLFAIAGFGPTRLLLPAGLRRHELLWVLPVGAVATGARAGAARLRLRPVRRRARRSCSPAASRSASTPGGATPGCRSRVRRAAGVASRGARCSCRCTSRVLIGAIALLPMFRGGFVTVIGNGSDAHLAVGTAEFLQDHHPKRGRSRASRSTACRSCGAPSRRSTSRSAPSRGVAGMEPYAVIATLAAALLALAALGFWLLARELLGAGAWAAGAAMGLVGLNRIDAVHRHAPVLQPDVGLHGDCRSRSCWRGTSCAARSRGGAAAVRGVPRRARVRLSAGAADPAASPRSSSGPSSAAAQRALAAAPPAAAQQAPPAVDRAAVPAAAAAAAGRAREGRRCRRACSRPATRSSTGAAT